MPTPRWSGAVLLCLGHHVATEADLAVAAQAAAPISVQPIMTGTACRMRSTCRRYCHADGFMRCADSKRRTKPPSGPFTSVLTRFHILRDGIAGR